MIVNGLGVFVSQRAEPSLAKLRPSLPYGGDHLHIDVAGFETLKVPRNLSPKTAEVVTVKYVCFLNINLFLTNSM